MGANNPCIGCNPYLSSLSLGNDLEFVSVTHLAVFTYACKVENGIRLHHCCQNTDKKENTPPLLIVKSFDCGEIHPDDAYLHRLHNFRE